MVAKTKSGKSRVKAKGNSAKDAAWAKEEAGFLAAIAAKPEEDGPRLAYADRLTARRDPRGEFIRCQVEAERLPEDDPRRLKLELRAFALSEKYAGRWLAPIARVLDTDAVIPHGPSEAESTIADLLGDDVLTGDGFDDVEVHIAQFRRGMVEELECEKPTAFVVRAAAVFRLAPALKSVRLKGAIDFRALAAVPELKRVRRLRIIGSRSIAPAPNDFAALAASPNLAALGVLEIFGCPTRKIGLQALANNAGMRQLKELTLNRAKVDAAGIRVLAGSPLLGRLERLNLSESELGDGELAVLASAARLPHALILQSNDVSAAGLRRLSRSGAVDGLAELDLGYNDICDDGAAVIADASRLFALRKLHLYSSGIGVSGIAALAESTHLTGLRSLDLGGNAIGDEGARVFTESCRMVGLEELKLHESDIGPKGAVALAECQAFGALRTLDLAENRIGDAGAVALAAAPRLSRLRELSLTNNGIRTEGAKALASSPHLRGLRNLYLRDNKLGAAGVAAIRKAFGRDVAVMDG